MQKVKIDNSSPLKVPKFSNMMSDIIKKNRKCSGGAIIKRQSVFKRDVFDE